MLRKRSRLRFPFACLQVAQPLPSRSEPQHSRATPVRLSEKGITIMTPRSVGMVVALLIAFFKASGLSALAWRVMISPTQRMNTTPIILTVKGSSYRSP